MREFMDLARSLGIRYSVPEPFTKRIKADIVVIDEECLSNYLVDSKAAYLVNNDNLKTIALELAGLREVGTLLVGIDVGSLIAYAVFANNKLVKSGKVRNSRDLINVLEELKESIKPLRTVVKIGESVLSSNTNNLMDLVENLVDLGYSVYIVEENETSRNAPSMLRGDIKDKDVNAAVNIALKDGLKIIK